MDKLKKELGMWKNTFVYVWRMTMLHLKKGFYTPNEFHIVKAAIEKDLDISQFNNPRLYNAEQMKWVVLGLENQLDVSKYNDPKRYNADQMKWIYYSYMSGLEEHVIDSYNQPERFEAWQMERDYSIIMRDRAELTMKEMREKLKEEGRVYIGDFEGFR